MKFLPDTELNLQTEDFLNSVKYSDTLKEMILSSPTDSAFTIGLFGEWGSGKSSIVKTVAEVLGNDSEEKIHFFTYDSWKYSNDSFRRTFLLGLRKSLGLENNVDLNSFYQSTTNDVQIERRLDPRQMKMAGIVLGIAIILSIVLISIQSATVTFTVTFIVSIIAILINILNRSFNDFKTSISFPPVSTAEQFEQYFNQITSLAIGRKAKTQKLAVAGDLKKSLNQIDKLVIVIDNIDRCQGDLAYQLLSDLKTFLSQTKKIVFLIPVDDKALKKHILKGGSLSKDADEFLRKLFNTTLRIRPFKTYDLYDYSKKINDKYQLGFSNTTIDIASKEFASNPRRIKQFFNNLSCDLEICSKLYGTEFVKENESLICKILVIREEWPDYYHQLFLKPGLLTTSKLNHTEEEKKYTEDERNLLSFLDLTQSIKSNKQIDIIEKILSINDQEKRIPNVATELINKKDLAGLEALINDETVNKESLTNELIQRIDKGIKNDLFELEVRNVFEILCALNKVFKIDEESNRRIDSIIKYHHNKIIKYIVDTDILCDYANDISLKFSFNLLNHSIAIFIKINLSNENENEQIYARKLFHSFVETPGNIETVKLFSLEFASDFKKGNKKLEDYKLSDNVVREVVDGSLLEYIISQTANFSKNDRHFNDLLYLSRIISFDSRTIISIVNRLYEISPSLDLLDHSILAERLINFNLLFEDFKGHLKATEDFATLEKILSLYSGTRTKIAGSGQVSIVADIITQEEVYAMINFCLTIYQLSNETIDIKPIIEKVLNKEENWKILFDLLIGIKENPRFNLLALRDLIFKDTEYSQNHLDLIKHILELKEGDNYLIPELEMADIIKRLTGRLITQPTPTLADALETWTKTERLKKALIENIEQLNVDDIIRLPENLIHLSFDKITQGDNIFLYQDSTDLLKALGNKGSNEHIIKLLKVIKIKLQQSEKVNDALDILEEIVKLNESQAYLIDADINAIENHILRDEALLILSNKSGLSAGKAPSSLNIIKATYRSDRNRVVRNVSRKLRSLITDNKIEVTVTNQLVDGNDPDVGIGKKLFVEYDFDGVRKSKEIGEGHLLILPD